MKKSWRTTSVIAALGTVIIGATLFATAGAFASGPVTSTVNGNKSTTTPIQHVVVIFQENVSFDHYFGTYPNATNPAGEPAFHASANTPTVNGLNENLLTNNPNSANPARLDPSQAITCDQDHNYTDEQKAYDNGLADKFVQYTTGGSCTDKNIVMDYYDGNTVTGLWNYAQHYAMSDNSFGTTFGPSTPGALNLISGQTHGAVAATQLSNIVNGTIIGDSDPQYDDCSTTSGNVAAMTGTNVGDLLNAKNVTWGWFQGGFRPSATTNGVATCGTKHTNIGGVAVTDYSPHHEPFQYYKSTANPHHLPPTSTSMIGKTDQANHQYDIQDFWTAVNNGNMPAVSYLKAPAYQDGHAGYSDPLDEQTFLTTTINQLQKRPEWKNTAVIIAYDDSDGWYDHVLGPIVSQSNSAADALTGTGTCGTAKTGAYEDRCGYGPRLPLLVISPYAKKNYIDNSVTDQSSILRFIEDNWNLGRIGDQSFDAAAGTLNNMFNFQADPNSNGYLFLNPKTGEPISNGR
ncbi:phospholipase C [Ktedonobacteria bacterium brp13]|nr:phospholipase C [Ktedonobacteria bacterium brp13]